MFDSAVLETVIGVAFVLILFSTVCAAVREFIEGLLKTRAAYLEYGIRMLLDDWAAAGLTRAVYMHPLVSGLFAGDYVQPASATRSWFAWQRRNLPSYIPARNFAAALLDIAARGAPGAQPLAQQAAGIDLDALRRNVLRMENEQVARVLLNAIDLSDGDINRALEHIAAWFDSGMDRVSGWYKRLSSRLIFVIALGLAVLLNVDILGVGKQLYHDREQRTMLVAYAQSMVADPVVVEQRQAALQGLRGKSFPIGWNDRPLGQILTSVRIRDLFGWIFTAFAATLGAPFWFDVLNRIMVIRATVKPHEKSREESSQDG